MTNIRNTLKFSAIDWGSDSAEKDQNLLSYYVKDNEDKVTKMDYLFVKGRKGTGKSAIRKYLSDYCKTKNYLVLDLSFAKKIYTLINNESDLEKDQFGKKLFYEYHWLAFLYRAILINIGQTYKWYHFTFGSTAYARKLAKNNINGSSELIELIKNTLKSFRIKAGQYGEFGIEIDDTVRNTLSINELEHHVLNLLDKYPKICIFIDDLDIDWNNSEQSLTLLDGLVEAVTVLESDKFKHKIKPIVFLRDDMYQNMLTRNLHSDKLGEVYSIHWNQDQLFQVITNRLEYYLKSNNLEGFGFNDIFPEKVGGNNYTHNWIIERTLNRPRELIQFVKEYTKMNITNIPDVTILKESEKKYSFKKLTDLGTEYINQYPWLQSVIEYLKSNIKGGNYKFSKNELEAILAQNSFDVSINEIINTLYQINFIGYHEVGGSGGGSKSQYYDEHHQSIKTDEIVIHPCFRKALELKERNT